MNQPAKSNAILFQERVWPNFTAFLPSVLLIPAAWLTLLPFQINAGWLLGLMLTAIVWALLAVGSPNIVLTTETLSVGKAQISRKFLGKATYVSALDSFAERGPKLNALAFLRLQSSVKTLVKVTIDDARDPAPYWLFSARSAAEIVKLLNKKQ